MEKVYFVYIMTNQYNRVLYTGVTNNLDRRVMEHQAKTTPSFTSRYNVDKLVYYEIIEEINYAIDREKQIKSWSRKKKLDLIESMNPDWSDLAEGFIN